MGIFSNPANNVGKVFRKQQKLTDKSSDQAVNEVNVTPSVNALTAEQGRLANRGLPATSLSGTGLAGSIDKSGNVLLGRSAETGGWMDRLRLGLSSDEQAYGDLLGRIRPGFGALSDSAVQTLENAKMKAVGNLRSQLAQRRVLGASFANDQEASVRNQYDQDIQRAKAEAMVQELTMTQAVIQDRSTARLNTINQGLSQINYETGVGATLMANTQNNMMKLSDAQTDIAKTLAGIQAQAAVARGNIRANLSSIPIQGMAQNAQLQTEGRAAQQESIGSTVGSVLGMFSFGGGGGAGAASTASKVMGA